MTFLTFLDACVLISSILRDPLLELGTTNAYRSLWSERTEDEATRTVPRLGEKRGYDAQELKEYVKRLTKQTNVALSSVKIVDWEESRHQVLQGPDPSDRYVVVAVIVERANVIVTLSINNFPESFVPHEPDVLYPDEFPLNLLDLNPWVVQDSVKVIIT